MRFTVSSTALSSKLNALSRVINSKNSLPILADFVFDVQGGILHLTASDNGHLRVSIRRCPTFISVYFGYACRRIAESPLFLRAESPQLLKHSGKQYGHPDPYPAGYAPGKPLPRPEVPLLSTLRGQCRISSQR